MTRISELLLCLVFVQRQSPSNELPVARHQRLDSCQVEIAIVSRASDYIRLKVTGPNNYTLVGHHHTSSWVKVKLTAEIRISCGCVLVLYQIRPVGSSCIYHAYEAVDRATLDQLLRGPSK